MSRRAKRKEKEDKLRERMQSESYKRRTRYAAMVGQPRHHTREVEKAQAAARESQKKNLASQASSAYRQEEIMYTETPSTPMQVVAIPIQTRTKPPANSRFYLRSLELELDERNTLQAFILSEDDNTSIKSATYYDGVFGKTWAITHGRPISRVNCCPTLSDFKHLYATPKEEAEIEEIRTLISTEALARNPAANLDYL